MLETEQPSEKFFESSPKLILKILSNTRKSKKAKLPERDIILRADHKLFGHMVLVASIGNVDVRDLLQHPLGLLPWALAVMGP